MKQAKEQKTETEPAVAVAPDATLVWHSIGIVLRRRKKSGRLNLVNYANLQQLTAVVAVVSRATVALVFCQ